MKITEPFFEYSGRWWFPADKNKKYHGTLKKSEKGIELVLEEYEINNFKEERQFKKVDLLLGELIDGTKITLQDCYQNNEITNSSGTRQKSYLVILIFFGKHFEEVSRIKFSKVLMSYNYLDEWLHLFPLKTNFNEKKFKLEYAFPKKILTKINEQFSIGIVFNVSFPSRSYFQKEATISQKGFIEFDFNPDKQFSEILSTIKIFQNFLLFSTQQKIDIDVIEAYCDTGLDVQEVRQNSPITIMFYNQTRGPQRELRPFEMLFSFRDIYKIRKKIFVNWFKIISSFGHTLYLYSNTLYKRDKNYPEITFLNLVQAIEGYHRTKYKGLFTTENKYKMISKSLTKAIPDNLDKNFKESLKSKIKYGNEYSLRKRLKEILEKNQTDLTEKFIPNKKRFISLVIDTRNYFVHRDKSLEQNSAKGKALVALGIKLQIIFELLILKELHFSDKQIKNLINRKLSGLNMEFLKNA